MACPLAGVESPMSLLTGRVFILLCKGVTVIGWKVAPSLLSVEPQSYGKSLLHLLFITNCGLTPRPNDLSPN